MTKEEEILRSAEEEFFRNGYDATSTAKIAQRAGVTHAMVNYYFKTKELLFIQILDNHVYELFRSLKPLMRMDGDVARVAMDAAAVLFDRINSDRKIPYLISDIIRTHPEFLLRYEDSFSAICLDSIDRHNERLEKSISAGQVNECTMKDIYNTVLTLSISPFMVVPFLENVKGLSREQVDAYLSARKAEMLKIIQLRYAAAGKQK